jgi:hypothetical protein
MTSPIETDGVHELRLRLHAALTEGKLLRAEAEALRAAFEQLKQHHAETVRDAGVIIGEREALRADLEVTKAAFAYERADWEHSRKALNEETLADRQALAERVRDECARLADTVAAGCRIHRLHAQEKGALDSWYAIRALDLAPLLEEPKP